MHRRTLLTTAAALPIAAALPAVGQTAPSGAEMRERASRLLTTLNTQQRNATLFGFGTRDRTAWNFMLGSRRAPGLALEQMTVEQKDLALDLLASGTSSLGLEKAENIMLQQDILRDEWGKGSADRNRERFSLQIYGEPNATAPWSWRWEGHHLSLTFTMVNDQIVSTTPSSFSSEPNTVPSGPHAGLVVLKEEETLGRALFTDFSDANRRTALISSASPGNIQSNSGTEISVARQQAGLALGEMSASQSDIAKRLLEVYILDVLPRPLAAQQQARLNSEDIDAIRFGWGGADLGGSIYYRLTGANILIEFASLRNQPQHLHAVFHDTARNFGRHVL